MSTSYAKGGGGRRPTPTPTVAPTPKDCLQVMTPAVDPATGVCDEFSSACEVPSGWTIVPSCPTL